MATYLKYCALICISFLFLLFGVHVLLMAYRLNDPYAFILTFFASNFIILISATLMIGFGLRWRHRWVRHRSSLQTRHDTDKNRESLNFPDEESGTF